MRLLACTTLALLFAGASLHAASAPTPDEKERKAAAAELSRVLGALDSEPLLAIYAPDVRALPDLFAKTNLSKMFNDPAYLKGLQAFEQLVNEGVGVEVKIVWPDFARQLSGPAVLAILPHNTDKPEDEGVFRMVFCGLTRNDETAAKLKELWPKVPPQANNLLSALRLQTVLPSELPALSKVPEWAVKATATLADVGVYAAPKKLGASLKAFVKQVGDVDDLDQWQPLIAQLDRIGIDHLILGTNMAGEFFTEELTLELAPDNGSNTVAHVAAGLKEDANKFDTLLAATPGEQDIITLMQLNPDGLAKDLPFALQALERYLRGKKWSRNKGKELEALMPDRFKFLLEKMQGSIALVGHPAISGDLRLVMVSALKTDGQETLREDLVKGLAGVGAEFQTLTNVRKIGNSPPLGATFQGRGLFSAPVIGLSAGWAWLCSNSASYTELTASFKTGKTLAAEATREKSEPSGRHMEWRDGDAFRLQIEMEKVVRIAYAAWLLSGNETPSFLGVKLPPDMLPPPSIFNGRLGQLRAGMKRQGNTVSAYSSCVLPGTPLTAVMGLLAIAEEIERAKQFDEDARNGHADAPAKDTPAPATRVSKEDGPAPADGAKP